jgi:uncharacterized protein (DUF433 family)
LLPGLSEGFHASKTAPRHHILEREAVRDASELLGAKALLQALLLDYTGRSLPQAVKSCSEAQEAGTAPKKKEFRHRRALECRDPTKAVMDRIEVNPKVMLGKPVIRGTRIPVELILRKLGEGAKETDLLDAYPRLTPQDIQAALLFAADELAHEETITPKPHAGNRQS